MAIYRGDELSLLMTHETDVSILYVIRVRRP